MCCSSILQSFRKQGKSAKAWMTFMTVSRDKYKYVSIAIIRMVTKARQYKASVVTAFWNQAFRIYADQVLLKSMRLQKKEKPYLDVSA